MGPHSRRAYDRRTKLKDKEASLVAESLGRSIHASARENIISSLFVAALNESDCLRKWVLGTAGLHRRRSVNMRAEPSYYLPRVVMRCAWPRNRSKRICVDLGLWNHNCDKQWADFEKLETRGPIVAKDLYGVYVEVKHDKLRAIDKDKYIKCAKALRGANDRINACTGQGRDHFAYFVVSSHHLVDRDRIRESGGKTQNDKNWHEVWNDPNIKYITTKEIYAASLDCRDGENMLKLFREYLRFLKEPTSVEGWKEELGYFARSNGDIREWVKDSIYWELRDLGGAAGFDYSHTPAKAGSVVSITFNSANHKMRARRGGDSELVKKLCVEFKGTTTNRMKPVDFTDIVAGLGRRTAKAEQDEIADDIWRRLKRVRQKLNRLISET